MIRHIGRSLRLSFMLMNGGALAALCAIPLLALGYFRIVESNGMVSTVMDFIIGAYDPSVGIPLLWFFCPLITMVVLILLWKDKDNPHIVSRLKSPLKVWVSYSCDIVTISLLAAVLLHGSLLIIGGMFLGEFSDFEATTSSFAHALGGRTLEGNLLLQGHSVTFLYAFLVLLFQNMAFGFLRWVSRRAIAVCAIMSIINLPALHNESSLVYDIIRNISGGSMSFPNPLRFPYTLASVAYESWLPDQGHGLLLLATLVVMLCALGVVFNNRKDWLH